MTFMKYFKKLMGWCPTKNSLQKERQEDCFSDFKLENGNLQLMPSSAGLQENRTLKARVNLVDYRWILRALLIGFLALIASLLLWTYSPEDSYLIIFSGLIMFLLPLIFLLNRPNAAKIIPGKIIIKQPMRKPVVIEKEDVTQISLTKNESHSLRWLIRLFCVFFFVVTIMMDLKDLERLATDYSKLSISLTKLSKITFFLVLYYNFELLVPYQQTLKVTTRQI
ncbi:DUF1673 family protein [Methanosarcina sp. Z-7115]|uniref:DUF1673 family protein n=1 Tax=Methanosarcina baikalica TaxID=3073890 RepID=A0ABU2D2L6_9EURY|nr:DUF1673 family protein [Methanosarcina sp. Z-7115]MDR7666226.1 DUF1673 family protein [Methanosarcina sp. Z-7115]